GSPFLVAYASAALHAMSYGLTHDRLLISALVYVSFAILRRLRYSWRYGFADELLRMRMLIVVDPQRALVRQRLMLEQAVAELTEPMHEGQGVNLFNGIQALKRCQCWASCRSGRHSWPTRCARPATPPPTRATRTGGCSCGPATPWPSPWPASAASSASWSGTAATAGAGQ